MDEQGEQGIASHQGIAEQGDSPSYAALLRLQEAEEEQGGNEAEHLGEYQGIGAEDQDAVAHPHQGQVQGERRQQGQDRETGTAQEIPVGQPGYQAVKQQDEPCRQDGVTAELCQEAAGIQEQRGRFLKMRGKPGPGVLVKGGRVKLINVAGEQQHDVSRCGERSCSADKRRDSPDAGCPVLFHASGRLFLPPGFPGGPLGIPFSLLGMLRRLRSDQDDPVGTPHSVAGRAAGIFEHVDGMDFTGVDLVGI